MPKSKQTTKRIMILLTGCLGASIPEAFRVLEKPLGTVPFSNFAQPNKSNEHYRR